MPDDPRLLEAADWVKDDVNGPATGADIERAEDMLRELDLVDPLRALLADEDRALDLIANAIYGVDGNAGPAPLRYAFPVLAALREVAGP